MKPNYLIDPWLIDLTTVDNTEVRYNRLTSLKNLKKIYEKYEMVPVRFVDEEFRTSLLSDFRTFQRPEWVEVGRLLSHLSINQKIESLPAEIIDTPCPDLLVQWAHWLCALGESGSDDTPPSWRGPTIFLPATRSALWPNHDENNRELRYKANGNTEPSKRNLVCIENYDRHAYFEPDLDPWRLGCVGDPKPDAPVDERPATCRRLPRPPQLRTTVPLSQLAAEARKITNPSCGMDDHYFYLPPVSWQPTERGRENWRNNSFECNGVVLKERGKTESGYVDRNDHVWVWDKGEKDHWDVKTVSDVRVARVSFTGVKKRS